MLCPLPKRMYYWNSDMRRCRQADEMLQHNGCASSNRNIMDFHMASRWRLKILQSHRELHGTGFISKFSALRHIRHYELCGKLQIGSAETFEDSMICIENVWCWLILNRKSPPDFLPLRNLSQSQPELTIWCFKQATRCSIWDAGSYPRTKLAPQVDEFIEQQLARVF